MSDDASENRNWLQLGTILNTVLEHTKTAAMRQGMISDAPTAFQVSRVALSQVVCPPFASVSSAFSHVSQPRTQVFLNAAPALPAQLELAFETRVPH